MRKIGYCLFSIMLFFTFCLCVSADHGDAEDYGHRLKYEVTGFSVDANGNIRVRGYAFIHRTQNYVTVYKLNDNGSSTGEVVMSNGGQAVRITAYDQNGNYYDFSSPCQDDNYNFYYQMFNHDALNYSLETYNDPTQNTCSGVSDATNCYYEDLGFNITISMNTLLDKFDPDAELTFYISAYNNSYGKWTSDYNLMIPPSINIPNNDFFDVISDGSKLGDLEFIAYYAHFQNLTGGKYQDGLFARSPIDGDNFYHIVRNPGNYSYVDGFRSISTNAGYSNPDFLKYTNGAGLYAICIDESDSRDACDSVDYSGYCNRCSGTIVSVYTTWVLLNGNTQVKLKLKALKKCDVVTQPAGDLACNDDNGKNYSSTCEELTIKTDSGVLGSVRIDQTGTLSSILLPSKTFAGGGFSFAIMYYHTIKWNYVKTPNTSEKRRALELAMMDKIKSYDQFVRELKITNLEFDGKIMDPSFLIKKCTASSTGKNYSGNGITVSCIFYFPDSVVDGSGTVSYKESGYGGISNKFYTPLDYFDDEYEINVRIEGMDRITTSSAREDSKDGIPWTGGPWSTNFRDCTIKVYPLLYNRPDNPYDVKSLTYNFIYRPIDINRPFPDRNPGINWFDWWSVDSNKVRLRTTYERPQYTTVLDSKTIENIKRYNNLEDGRGGYLDWGTMRGDKSSFIDNDAFGFVQKRDNLWGDS